VQIAFYKGTRPGIEGLFSRAVRWWTNGPFSHCEAVLVTDIAGRAWCASSSFIDGGVRLKWIDLAPEHWTLIDVDADPQLVHGWYTAHAGAKYDIGALIGFVGRRGDGSKDKFMCSESVAAALGFPEAWRLDPNTLHAVLTRPAENPQEEPALT
jgi:hypothetical protein